MIWRQWTRLRAMAVLGAVLMAACGGWWLCDHSAAVAFLPARAGGQWIVVDIPPQAKIHAAVPLGGEFAREFTLDARPAQATLSVCAFKTARVVVNGQTAARLDDSAGRNWKRPTSLNIAPWLRAGTNFIAVWVTNSVGPPALWLSLELPGRGTAMLGSDATWRGSLEDGPWLPARLAETSPGVPRWSPLYDDRRIADSAGRVWPLLAFFAAAVLAVLAGGKNRHLARMQPEKRVFLFVALVLAARAAVMINNACLRPTQSGFDEPEHAEYIGYIQNNGSLPLPDKGWEMYQPPLYYALAALTVEAATFDAGSAEGKTVLHLMNGAVGLAHCWLAFLCLRLIFPGNFAAQAAGLLAIAFLPPHLYLSHYTTNEPLAAFFVTLALYFCLRALAAEQEDGRLYLGLGLAFGAALLTKVSALLAAPFFAGAIGARLGFNEKCSWRNWLCGPGVALLACVVVCGWYYGWLAAHYGRLVVGNWDSDVGKSWWQDPGFHTSADFLSFGQCLQTPLYSGIHGFNDGVYSTLWGDGLISGRGDVMFRPPWNYDLMNAVYWLSLGPAALAALGLAAALGRFARRGEARWFLVAGLAAGYGFGIVYMALKVPSYAQAKAFYGFPALAPFGVLIAAGWDWLAQRGRTWRTALWMVVGVWAIAAVASYWIRADNFETWRERAVDELDEKHAEASLASIDRALQLNPADPHSHRMRAEALIQINQIPEGMQELAESLKIRPESPEILSELANLMIVTGSRELGKANAMAQQACELTCFRQADQVSVLALSQASLGQTNAAIATARRAIALAVGEGHPMLVQKNEELIERVQHQLP